jgi:1,2-diacylglycerol 3-alpha-glucosyltransferase
VKKYGLPKENIVLYTGRINQEKNLDVLIKAIPDVLKEIDAHFLFCGSGGTYKQEMIDLTKTLKVSDKTTFIDFLDWKDYPNIYPLANVFVMPAEAELQSIVTMEAIASGLPVVAVDKGAVPELARSGNGFLFEPKNSKQLAGHIVKILSDKKLQKTMRAKSLELAKKHSMGTICSQYEKVYKNLINNYKT